MVCQLSWMNARRLKKQLVKNLTVLEYKVLQMNTFEDPGV